MSAIELVIHPRRRDLGGGLEVGRVLPWAKRRMVGPFVFFDRIGPAIFPADIPGHTDVRPHPHIGLSTLTYLFAGEMVHRDSLGFHQIIRPGEVNWMTAGRGISHSERFETMREHGGPIDGLQIWIALPETDEEIEPAFVHFAANDLPARAIDGVQLRVLAGEAFGLRSPVSTHSPLFYVHAELPANARLEVPDEHSEHTERAVYVVHGEVEVEGEWHTEGQMLVLASGSTPTIATRGPATVMLLGGEPLGERHIWWNFVSSSLARIEQAKADWRAGRIPLPVGDDREFIPLPEDPPPPPEPMS